MIRTERVYHVPKVGTMEAGDTARGVLVGAFGADAIRVVTHRDVSRADCIDAAEAQTEEIGAQMKTASPT